MEILCTRPSCPRPQNTYPDLDDISTLETVQQRYCTSCGMPLILAGRYIPSRLLGQGGFGAAFLATDRYTPALRQCVVKQFQPSGNLNQQELAIAQGLFKREAAVLERLGHKHDQIPDLYAFFPLIVPTKDRSGEEQLFYLVQEFIEGQTLETELAAQGKFSEGQVVAILEDILNILKFVHDNGSIHRDIKPSNIIRTSQGILYLLDFGAVKEIAAGASNNPQTRSTGIYSMGFAPPEQMNGTQVFPSTDLYALAVTCLNLLTGKGAEELYDTYNNRWDWKSRVPQVSDKLAGILDRMLLSTPRERFQSADEVLNALKAPAGTQTPPPRVNPNPPPQLSAKPQTPQPITPPPPISRRPRASFSLLEILFCAGFTGFEGSLLFLAWISLLGWSGISLGLWGMCVGGLIFAQYGRIIEKIDLIIIAAISLGLVWFIPLLHQSILNYQLERFYIAVLATLAGAALIAVAALFRLVFQILRRLM